MRTIALAVQFIVAVAWVRAQATETPKLTVQVVDGRDGSPLNDVDLALADLELKIIAGPVKPDRHGKHEFRVAPGNYVLQAERLDTGLVYHGQLPNGNVETIKVEPTGATVTFRISPTAKISGFVVDESGDRIAGIHASVHTWSWGEGRSVLRQVYSATTDERGAYQFPNVQPGRYMLCATPSPHGPAVVAAVGVVDFAAPPNPRYYQRTCYPDGAQIEVAAGGRITQDFTLAAKPGISIRGLVQDLTTPVSVELADEEGMSGYSGQRSTHVNGSNPPNPEFAFLGVHPGKYRLRGQLQAEGATYFASLPVHSDGSDVSGLELRFHPSARVEVAFSGSSPELIAKLSSLALLPEGGKDDPVYSGHGANKAYVFPSLKPGTYWLQTRTTGGICIVGAQLGEHDVFQRPLIVAAGAKTRLIISLSQQCAAIEGRVMAEGKPVRSARVTLLLRGSPRNPGDCFSVFTSTDGVFEMHDLAPGTYPLWAWVEDNYGSSSAPGTLSDVEKQALMVTLTAGAPAKLDVGLTNGKGGVQ